MTTTAARAKAHKPFVPSREDLADIREVARLSRYMGPAGQRELNAERDVPLKRLVARKVPIWFIAEQADISEEAIFKARSRRRNGKGKT